MPNIVLVGFMGTGKSSVGKKLAYKLRRRLVNTDDLIERKTGMVIGDIFRQKGESYFRRKEREVIKEVSRLDDVVIDAGGGVVINEENIRDLKENGIIFCLNADAETILRRTRHESHRPLLNVENPLLEIKRLLGQREKYYKRADYQIDTSGKSIEEVAARIIEIVNAQRGRLLNRDVG